MTNGKGFGDVEKAEEDEGDETVTPVGWAEEQSDSLAGDFVDDDDLRVFAAALAGDDGSGGDAEGEGEGDDEQQAVDQDQRRGVGEEGEGGPEKQGGHGAPCAGAWLAETCAKEGSDGPGPEGFLLD